MPEKIQRSFTGGEISPELRARADMAKYSYGLALCENFFVRPQGGLYSRPGTKHIGTLKDQSKQARLVRFTFNTDETYVLVFEENVIRFIKDGGYILSGGVPYEVATTYTEAELPRLGFTQDADVLTIVHWDHNPAELSRITDTNWTLTDIDFTPTISTPTWPASPLTTTGGGAGTNNKVYEYVITTVDSNGVESLPSTAQNINTPSLTSTAGVRVTWNAVVGASYYRVYKDPSVGTGMYGWIGDSNTTSFDDFNIAPLTSDSPPSDNTPFATADNKPIAVAHYQQRRIFANTENNPQTVYCTQTGIYNSLRSSEPTRDDDAIEFTLKAKQVNEIRYIIALDSLILLTAGGEWRVTEGQDEVLTPSTIGMKVQSYNGTAWITPEVVDSNILYIQEKGARVRDISYQFVDDKFQGSDLSIMSEHLFSGYEITDMAYAAEPFGIVWFVRNDGKMLGLTYQRQHDVFAWHQHDFGGQVESVTTISEDSRDATYIIVNRTIDGSTVRHVERLEPRFVDSAENVWCVDDGLQYVGAAATTITGLDHLEGEDVCIVADGNEVTGLTVNSGEITLPRAASTVVVGLPFTPTVETLDIDIGSPTDTLKSKEVSVSRVTIEMYQSRGGWVGPIKDDDTTDQFREIKPRFDSYGYDPIPLSSYKAVVYIDPQWSKGGGIKIEQRSPFPMAILSIIPQVDAS